jgi:uncharacterized damage-inducible protein DinB
MTTQNPAVGMLHDTRDLFEKTASRLEEDDADFRPRPEMMSVAELDELLPEGIMSGLPKRAILHGMADHTAHHRGSLAVYARMLGKVPPMPYA